MANAAFGSSFKSYLARFFDTCVSMQCGGLHGILSAACASVCINISRLIKNTAMKIKKTPARVTVNFFLFDADQVGSAF